MNITTRVVFDIASGRLLEREGFDYEGPIISCKGEQRDTARIADEERARANRMQDEQRRRNEELYGSLLPRYQGIADAPLSEAEKRQIRMAPQEAISGSYGAAGDEASNRMARTRNIAGYGEMMGNLARARARDSASAARASESDIAGTEFARRMGALGGMSGLYGVNTNLLERELGLTPELLKIRQEAMKGRPGFWENLSSGLGQGLGQAAGAWAGG